MVEKKQQSKKLENDKTISSISLASELGFSISLPIVGGAFLGQFLDNKFHSAPRMTLSLVFLGVFFAIANIYLIMKNNSK